MCLRGISRARSAGGGGGGGGGDEPAAAVECALCGSSADAGGGGARGDGLVRERGARAMGTVRWIEMCWGWVRRGRNDDNMNLNQICQSKSDSYSEGLLGI